jgi:Arc/MetJ-type ribon-helix-helix transcriptional regulator
LINASSCFATLQHDNSGFQNDRDCRTLIDNIPQIKYIGSMKVKTSITLSDDLVRTIDQYDQDYKNRSDFIETAIRAFIKQIVRDRQNKQDVEIINRNAERLNAEAADVLQVALDLPEVK